MIHIYNTLTKAKELLKSIEPNHIKLYVCGLTVYDDCHVGHGRLFVWFDALVRYLRNIGYKVTYVRNITDIDDKIIKRAKELNISYQDLTKQVIASVREDEKLLNIIPPDVEPKVTENIVEIIEMIQTLIDKEFAYVASNGDVYYSVEKFKDYGKLAHQDIDALCSGIRVETNEEKRNPLDFVLWKAAKENEPYWQAPWGNGRPGWHIECSAMAKKHLGITFDIHGGGSDLQFPHHQNEVAQSEAANDSVLANYWMHIGFIQVNDEKMAKSLGNFFNLKEVLKNYHPEVFRYFILTSHYRSPINFSEDNLENAESALKRFYIALRDMKPEANYPVDTESKFYREFHAAMADDFNTPKAIAVLFDLVREINQSRDNGELDKAKTQGSLLLNLAAALGLLQDSYESFLKFGVDSLKIEKMIKGRVDARQNRDWPKADKIRSDLTNMGISLEDTPAGTTWLLESRSKYRNHHNKH